MQYRGAIMTRKERDGTICLLMACCQRVGATLQSRSSITSEFCHSCDRFAFFLLTQTLHISKKAKDASESSTCHVSYPKASSHWALVKVMLVWHTRESWSMCLYVSVTTRILFLCPHVRFQLCLILFAFKLSFMLFQACVATVQVEKSHPFICVSLMFSCCLFASNGILIKAHIFHVHQSLLLKLDGGQTAACTGNNWFICNE